MTDWRKYIVVDAKILTGKPVIKNTRISVELILEKLAEGESFEQILLPTFGKRINYGMPGIRYRYNSNCLN